MDSTKPNRSDSSESLNRSGAEPSGPGDNPGTAVPVSTGIRSATPENSAGKINPSAPGDTGTTPNTAPQK